MSLFSLPYIIQRAKSLSDTSCSVLSVVMMSIRLLMFVSVLPPAIPEPPSMLYPVIIPVYIVVFVSYCLSIFLVINHAITSAIIGSIARYHLMRYRKRTMYLKMSIISWFYNIITLFYS